MTDDADLLARYDAQLRGENEALGAERRVRLGPLWISTLVGGRGFITSQRLDGPDGDDLRALVGAALEEAASDPSVVEVEWKTRGHDGVRDALHEALVDARLRAAGAGVDHDRRRGAARPRPPAAGRRRAPVRDRAGRRAPRLGRRRRAVRGGAERAPPRRRPGPHRPGREVWVAEADGVVVSTGRLEPVPGTDFAGIWGGATRPEWRRRGVYRALTAARARSALRRGVRWINSDSTEWSRPILERSGFAKVSTTTPYEWRR